HATPDRVHAGEVGEVAWLTEHALQVVEAADHLERAVERAEVIARREVTLDGERGRRPRAYEVADQLRLERGRHQRPRGAVGEQGGQVVRVGSQERILEVDQVEPAVPQMEVPLHEVAMDEHGRVPLEGCRERVERGEKPRALVGREAPSVARLDAVLDEVLELPAREPPVEAAAEGEARWG